MNILNPDLSHSEFLTESLSDINAANTLLDIGQFSQAAYMFQQSVEKSCKYFGLTIKILDYEDLRKTGHLVDESAQISQSFHWKIIK